MNVKKFLLSILFALFLTFNVSSVQAVESLDMLATTASSSDPWSLSIYKDDEGNYGFVIYNLQTEQTAIVEYERDIYNFYLNKKPGSSYYDPLIFIMMVADSPRDVDADFGEWDDDIHLLPVYALFDYVNGNVVLDSYLSSGAGLYPSHYQGRINSPYHIKLAEVFLTHMPALHRAVEDAGVYLP